MENSFNFGTRKLQKVGDSFMVPVPSQWVQNMHLNKGDPLKIEMLEDRNLKFSIPNM
jgi:antitoxin component of MazEF toxin-antitoxin module